MNAVVAVDMEIASTALENCSQSQTFPPETITTSTELQ
jgi:hypothetical protein